MKNIKSIIILFAAIAVIGSCKKGDGKIPDIAFKTGGSYVSMDKSVNKGEVIVIGINAYKTETKDVLKTFSATKSYDAANATTFVQETMSGASEDAYSKDMTITTRSVPGNEKYTFTITTKDGLTNQVSIMLTVQ